MNEGLRVSKATFQKSSTRPCLEALHKIAGVTFHPPTLRVSQIETDGIFAGLTFHIPESFHSLYALPLPHTFLM